MHEVSGEPDRSTRQRQASKGRLLIAMMATAVWSFGLAGQASAQYTNPPPTGGAATDVGAASAGAGALQVTGGASGESGGAEGGLPVTGGDVLGLTAIGVASIAVGGLVLAVRRRSTPS